MPPATSTEHSQRNPGAESTEMGSSSATGSPPSSQSRRKNVTNACQPCRDRRTKCDSTIPCQRCVALRTRCYRTTSVDGRSTVALKRKFDDYEQSQQLLANLLEAIRDGADEQVGQIISLIRGDASLLEIKACIVQQISHFRQAGKEPSPKLEQVRDHLDQLTSIPPRRSRTLSTIPQDKLQIVRLIDEPLFQVSASPWTDITEDNNLVSNLISVWLTWDHIMYNWVDPKLFLRDMIRGQLGSPFCSPFLVHCVLAWACPYSDYTEARSRSGKSSRLMHDFVDQAKRLLDEEIKAGPSLTLVQGITYLYLAIVSQGQDKLGYQYKVLAIDLAHKLSRLSVNKMQTLSESERQEMVKAVDHTCWGVYNTMTVVCMAFLKPQAIRAPRRPKPQFDPPLLSDTWSPYPRHGQVLSCYIPELFHILCSISTIMARINQHMFGDDEDNDNSQTSVYTRTEQEIVHLHLQIVRILADFPDHLRPCHKAPPSVLVHRLWILGMMLATLLFLKQPREESSSQIRSLARNQALITSLEIAQICRYYMDSYGVSLMGNSASQAISMALYIILERSIEKSDFALQITDLCICLRAMSRRWPICMGMLRMVQHYAVEIGAELPEDTTKLFEDFENLDWSQMDPKELTSGYPQVKSTLQMKDELGDMDDFLKMMDGLQLNQSLQR